MPDELRVDLARIEGRLNGVERGLDRQEQACERRAAAHVDSQLYQSERTSLRDEVNGLGRRLSDLAADVAAARREQAATRRWAITTAVVIGVAILSTLTTVLT